MSGSVTRELSHEWFECSVLFAQPAAERADEVLGHRATALDEGVEPVEQAGGHRPVLLEGSNDGAEAPVTHVFTVAPARAPHIP